MIRILIADDHQMIRDAWSLILGKERRFKIIGSCADSAETVKMCRKLRPGILLMDINMSPFNGIEATRKIRKISPATGIIAVTMHNHPAYAKKMLRLGAMGYVTKNSSINEMKKAILVVSAGGIYICEEIKELLSDEEKNVKQLSAVQRLTEREMEVANLIKTGLSSKEISEKLDISVKTVEVHRYNLLRKLKVKNAVALTHIINDSANYI